MWRIRGNGRRGGELMHELLIICMMGLPRSGKSTLARALSEKCGIPIVNRDSIRLALHGQRFVPLAEPMVKAISGIMVNSLFIAGHHTVVVDETNIRRSTRDFWAGLNKDAKIEFWHVDTSKDVCLERARSMNDAAIQPVIERMAEDFEPLQDDEKRFDEKKYEI
jgi:predicted kinase